VQKTENVSEQISLILTLSAYTTVQLLHQATTEKGNW